MVLQLSLLRMEKAAGRAGCSHRAEMLPVTDVRETHSLGYPLSIQIGEPKMSIMELGALGEFVAALAVLITLIFLTLQVRQARQETARALMQSRTENGTHIGMGIAASESLAGALTRVSEALSEQPSKFADELIQRGVDRTDALRVDRWCMVMWRQHLTTFELSDELGRAQAADIWRNSYSTGTQRLFWDSFTPNLGNRQADLFIAYVNERLPDTISEAATDAV